MEVKTLQKYILVTYLTTCLTYIKVLTGCEVCLYFQKFNFDLN